jgi:chromosome segregation ATPase
MTATVRRVAHALGLASLLCITGGADAPAQPRQSAPAIVDTFVAVIPRRPLEDIKKDIEQSNAQRMQAKHRLAQAQEEVRTLETIINVREKDLEALEGYIDTLDSDKKADEIAIVKRKIALLEKLRDLLELRKKVREGEAEAATAAVAYTEAQEEVYELEGTLVTKRSDRVDIAKKPGSSADLAAIDLAIKRMESEVLERWEKALKKHEDSVSEEQDLLSLLNKLAEAQDAYHAQ